jgi:hypothetical protein
VGCVARLACHGPRSNRRAVQASGGNNERRVAGAVRDALDLGVVGSGVLRRPSVRAPDPVPDPEVLGPLGECRSTAIHSSACRHRTCSDRRRAVAPTLRHDRSTGTNGYLAGSRRPTTLGADVMRHHSDRHTTRPLDRLSVEATSRDMSSAAVTYRGRIRHPTIGVASLMTYPAHGSGASDTLSPRPRPAIAVRSAGVYGRAAVSPDRPPAASRPRGHAGRAFHAPRTRQAHGDVTMRLRSPIRSWASSRADIR